MASGTEMNILMLNTLYRGGGAERSARELSELLNDRGHRTSMLVARRREGDPAGVTAARLPAERYGNIITRFGGVGDWTRVGSKIRLRRVDRQRTDIVHIHNLAGNWISIKAVAALCRRVPSVWTLHDEWSLTGGLAYDLTESPVPQGLLSETQQRVQYGRTRYFRRLKKFLASHMPRPSLLITPSEYLRSLALRSGRFEGVPIERVPYGLPFMRVPETKIEVEQARDRLGLSRGVKVILIVAAQLSSPYKGIPLAIEALRQIPRDAAEVLIVGRGGEGLTADIRQRCSCTGFISDERSLACAFRAADVVALPSVADNFPYTALESMACARPFVCFAVGGMREMAAAGAGAAVPAFDVRQLAQNLLDLLDCPARRGQMGEAGRRWVEANCSVGHWAARHEALYALAQRLFSSGGGAETGAPVAALHAGSGAASISGSTGAN